MSGFIDKEFRPFVRELEGLGCHVVVGGKHPKLYLGSRFLAPLPTSGSDVRGLKNLRRQLRQKGLAV